MSIFVRVLLVLLVSGATAQASETAATQFLRYIYGADDVELAAVCHLTDDVWMLRGAKDADALEELDDVEVPTKATGIITGLVGKDLYFIETREGKVDPAFNLDSIYQMHRQLVLHFLYAVLSGNREGLEKVTTDVDGVELSGVAITPGDADHYVSILQLMPVLRLSLPAEDAQSHTIRYRVPVGEEGLTLTLVKHGSQWKIDTSSKVVVPSKFFVRE